MSYFSFFILNSAIQYTAFHFLSSNVTNLKYRHQKIDMDNKSKIHIRSRVVWIFWSKILSLVTNVFKIKPNVQPAGTGQNHRTKTMTSSRFKQSKTSNRPELGKTTKPKPWPVPVQPVRLLKHCLWQNWKYVWKIVFFPNKCS